MRFAVSSVVSAIILATSPLAMPAHALSLSWPNGVMDLTTEEATTCTLLVHSYDSPLPSSWTLVWAATDSTDHVLRFLPFSNPSSLEADGRELIPGRDGYGFATNADTMIHVSLATSPDLARYIVAIPAHIRCKIALIRESDLNPVSEVLINGGNDLSYPPVVVATTVHQNTSGADISISGVFLSQSQILPSPSASSPVAVTMLENGSDTSISARLTMLRNDQPFTLVVSDTSRRIVPLTLVAEPTHDSTKDMIIRFRPGTVVNTPMGNASASPNAFAFAQPEFADTLIMLGVQQMARVFPEFRREDVYATNSLGEPIHLEDLSDIYIATLSQTANVDSSIAQIGRLSSRVHYACVNSRQSTRHLLPLNLSYAQWNLRNEGQDYFCPPDGVHANATRDIGAESAWNLTVGDPPPGVPATPIAILDTGIDDSAHDFRLQETDCVEPNRPTRVRYGPTYAGNPTVKYIGDHGTAVAGIAAGIGYLDCAYPQPAIPGVAWRAIPWSYRVFDSTTTQSMWVAQALNHASSSHIPICNMSFGVEPSALLVQAAKNAFYSGTLLVASSGNLNINATLCPSYPAALASTVCSVGAAWMDGGRWETENITDYDECDPPNGGDCVNTPDPFQCAGSTWGDFLDLVAPGGAHIVAPGANYNRFDFDGCQSHYPFTWGFGGTSASAPLVSGVAALLKTFRQSLTGEDMEEILKRTARGTLGNFGHLWNPVTGYGSVRADSALQFLDGRHVHHGRVTATTSPSGVLAVVSEEDQVRRFIQVSQIPGGTYEGPVTKYTVRSTVNFTTPFSQVPAVWVRSSGSRGARDTQAQTYDGLLEIEWARVVPGTITTDHATVESHVYLLETNPPVWVPDVPDSAAIAYTAVGFPASLDVPTANIETSFVVSPNPAARTVHFGLRGFRGTRSIVIHDVAGRRIRSLAIEPNATSVSWDLRSDSGQRVAAGMYLCQLGLTSGHAERKVFVVP